MGLQDMFSAISGLQANSTWLDVIGNNISNVNTVGYKASRVEFSDQISQTLYGGTGDESGDDLGGTDPEQVGLGTRVASIQALFTEGTLQTTGISTDLAIVGNGFLVSKSGDNTYLTRAGNLTFDSTGNLVDQNGGLIQGFTAAIQYTNKTIDTAADSGTNNLIQTSAALVLNNTDPSAATDINIPATMTEPPSATSIVNFSGNLDSFLQATDTAAGGVLNLGAGTAANPSALPLGDLAAADYNGAVFNFEANPNGNGSMVLQQIGNADWQGAEGNANPGATGNVIPAPTTTDWANPLMYGAESIAQAQANAAAGTADYVWDQQPPQTPAKQITETVYSSNGTPQQVTINFYQVNDLGDGGINNPAGPNQVAYAWYAFNTTDGGAVSTANLIGGTGLIEGELAGAPNVGYDRGTTGNQYWGDLIMFNTDGSLESTGGVEDANGVAYQAIPDIYLPPVNDAGAPPADNGAAPGNPAPASPLPTQGAQITQVSLNFGTAGILGFGQRDGLYSDAEGTYQLINGVNTYVPSSTAYASSQNGYAEGELTGTSFNSQGVIEGTFSNGQTTAIGQVILAEPNNPDGLVNVGDNYYEQSPNSGPMYVGTAGQLDLGTIQGGTLELSNVNLTTELTNMIIAQRGFDMNSRVISVENANLQVLSQLGQGG